MYLEGRGAMVEQGLEKDSITFVLDGKTVSAKRGETIIQAADRYGVYIPRFCYHEKLSVVANCRMCLVEVKGAPKTLPACATAIAQDMEVDTKSQATVHSQRAIMEFLLINHPLDCPVCDQGGECELQDLAMGFGRGVSRFYEGKRSVLDEDLGPLIATHMTRCIHCTRCVRFGNELAGSTALAELNRGEDMAIGTYLQKGMHSELSANAMDVCPVGALTSKPFRFRGRSWSFAQHQGWALHDALGSSLFFQTLAKGYDGKTEVMRVLPRKDEQTNSVWLSDRDRFSYQGFTHTERLIEPMIKHGNIWKKVSWKEALREVSNQTLKALANSVDSVCAVVSPNSSMEEGYALAQLLRANGCPHVDHRVAMAPVSKGYGLSSKPSMDRSVASFKEVSVCLLFGCYLRHEAPMAAFWLRQAVSEHNAMVWAVNPVDYDWNFSVAYTQLAAGEELLQHALGCLKALCQKKRRAAPPLFKQALSKIKVTAMAKEVVATWCKQAADAVIVLGQYAQSLSCFESLHRVLQAFVSISGRGSLIVLVPGANSVGLHQVGCVPNFGPCGQEVTNGDSCSEYFSKPRSVYWLHQVECEMDVWDAHAALSALKSADCVVCVTSFASDVMKAYADVLLPIGLPVEAGGTYAFLSGEQKKSVACVPSLGMALPGWRVYAELAKWMGKECSIPDTQEAWSEILDSIDKSERVEPSPSLHFEYHEASGVQYQRLGDSWLYGGDCVVRRAKALQEMASWSGHEKVRVHPDTLLQAGIDATDSIGVRQGIWEVVMPLEITKSVHKGVVWCPSGLPNRPSLPGPRSGGVELFKAQLEKA